MSEAPPEFDRESVVDLLMLAQEQDRTIIEFVKRGGVLYGMEITDHVDALEELEETK